jgi:hypothetical protein
LDESITAYPQAIRIQPTFSVDAYNHIGIIHLHQQRFADAAAASSWRSSWIPAEFDSSSFSTI